MRSWELKEEGKGKEKKSNSFNFLILINDGLQATLLFLQVSLVYDINLNFLSLDWFKK